MKKQNVLVSEKQLHAIETFFSSDVEDILYGGAARGGKSETIGIILGICISAFPGSAWLIARTVLADLKATTLSTFFSVIKRFGYGEKSYRDKVRDEKHIEFVNESKLYVIQVNHEPGDPEYDRIGSYGYTGAFLDEGQQMSNKVREVVQGRLSETSGSFSIEAPKGLEVAVGDTIKGWECTFRVVGEVLKMNQEKDSQQKINKIKQTLHNFYKKDIKTYDNGSDVIPEELNRILLAEEEYLKYIKKVKSDYNSSNGTYIDMVVDGGRNHYIKEDVEFHIPYTITKIEEINGKIVHTYAWDYKGCIFTGCNPGTNFTRSDFYNPWKNGTLPAHMSFIPAKVNDNPWVDKQYVTRLERLPETSIRKQRLLYGNFDYDDNPGILYDQQTISQMFDGDYDGDRTRYIVVDAARQGKDSTEIGIWEGLELIKIIQIKEGSLTTQAEKIQMEMDKYHIPAGRVIVDEVGVGGGLVDMLGCVGFIGNAQPLHPYSSKILTYKKRNYLNLRTQAFYYLQRYMGQVKIRCDQDTKDLIIEELLTVKEKDVDNDSKLQIIAKKLMKEELGRSPDKADMISMRMRFIIKEHHKGGETEVDNQMLNNGQGISFIDELIAQSEKEDIFGKIEDFEPDLSVYG